jgi:valyl-tRNA synthetase
MLPNRYNFREIELRLAQFWADHHTYAFGAHGSGPTFTIDTSPLTASGELHIGHCFSYTQNDVIARFHHMRGERILSPMGFDDNGLPTERFVDRFSCFEQFLVLLEDRLHHLSSQYLHAS